MNRNPKPYASTLRAAACAQRTLAPRQQLRCHPHSGAAGTGRCQQPNTRQLWCDYDEDNESDNGDGYATGTGVDYGNKYDNDSANGNDENHNDDDMNEESDGNDRKR